MTSPASTRAAAGVRGHAQRFRQAGGDARAARGEYPRGFVGEQPYWTLLGVGRRARAGLIGEDGAIELSRSGLHRALRRVRRQAGDLADAFDAIAAGRRPADPDGALTHPEFGLTSPPSPAGRRGARNWSRATCSPTPRASRARLRARAAGRPFQVNPPPAVPQHARRGEPDPCAGHGRPDDVADGRPRVSWRSGPMRRSRAISHRAKRRRALRATIRRASWRPTTAARIRRGAVPGSPTAGRTQGIRGARRSPARAISVAKFDPAALQEQAAAEWRKRLDAVRILLPAQAKPLVETLHAALAHILMSRDGPELRVRARAATRVPGSATAR